MERLALGQAPRVYRACREAGRTGEREDRRRFHPEHQLWRPVEQPREPGRDFHRGVRDGGVLRALSMALYDQPAVKADLARWNATLLMPSPMPQYNLVGLGDAPRSLDEFEGLSVRATGGIGSAMEAVGAVPTSMSATEVRQAMDSGVVKAVAFAPHAHMAFGTIENGKWWTSNLNPGTVNCPVVANTDALDSLSDEHREALLSSIDEALDYYVDFYTNNTMEAWGPALDERGIERISYDAESLAAFEEAVAGPAAEAWIEDMSARGLPAQELYDFATGKLAELKGN